MPNPFPATRRSVLKASAALALPAMGFGFVPLPFDDLRAEEEHSPRQRVLLDDGWRFHRGDPAGVRLLYDVRQALPDATDEDLTLSPVQVAGSPAAANAVLLKPWMLPSANRFIDDPSRHHTRPTGNPVSDLAFVNADFDDGAWQAVTVPHDWAITGPFLAEGDYGGMGRLPSWGIGWYRRTLDVPASDAGRSVFLDVEGAMSYAAVWLNGALVGGWPYGYNSWRLDLTPHIRPGGVNQLAIRLNNPPASSRWYPGGGLYRNVWLTKTDPVHVGQWGTRIKTPTVSRAAATIELAVTIDNLSAKPATIDVATDIMPIDSNGNRAGPAVAHIPAKTLRIAAGSTGTVAGATSIAKPRLWGPPPTQQPNRYLAVTTVSSGGRVIDRHETPFGIRSIRFDPNIGVFVNDEHILLRGVDRHHDLGPLGAAFNRRAAQRQLEALREMGGNALRMSHNPPSPDFLDLCDAMGFLVLDEIFDVWQMKKTPLDFHLIFDDWHEPDLRAMLRRDRNHPSIFLWSIGNEVGEQNVPEGGAAIATRLKAIAREEDPTRPITSAMNTASPDSPLPGIIDVIGLNYQGIGVRSRPGTFAAFHEAYPDKMILSTESAAALSSRGAYQFPVSGSISGPVRPGVGGDPATHQVSAYELYAADFGTSADTVFSQEDQHPFVAGEFVWCGWDYLGEPTPYYSSRSAYFGIIDLAGFSKDRFYLYQSRWRPDLPMAHILPHWTWPGREEQITPVHVFTSGDEAELFVNGLSQGRQKRAPYEYRFRWDYVVYAPGELKVVTYKDGKPWATAQTKTAGAPAKLEAKADRTRIAGDGRDVAFVSVAVIDKDGVMVPTASNRVTFEIDGPGEIVATANGDPTSFEPFRSHSRDMFNGRVLAIVRGDPDKPGRFEVRAGSAAIQGCRLQIDM